MIIFPRYSTYLEVHDPVPPYQLQSTCGTWPLLALLATDQLRFGVVSPSTAPTAILLLWLTGVEIGSSGWWASALVKFTTKADVIVREHQCHHRLLRAQVRARH